MGCRNNATIIVRIEPASSEQIVERGLIMITSKIESLGVEPSKLGYGCMRFPTLEDRSINEEEAQKLLDTAIAGGVTYIDTAWPYHEERSEEFVGRALQKHDRDSYYLATKLPVWKVEKREDVRYYLEEQLRRLRTDHIDFYLLHALSKERWQSVLQHQMIEELEALKAEGKIRFLGFSFHDEFDVFEEIIRHHAWDFCQIQFNYVDTEIQAGLRGLELAESLGIPVIVMEPVKGGSLAKLPAAMEAFFRTLRPKDSVASWAFRFVGSHPNVKIILSGMTTMEQLEDNLNTFRTFQPLDEAEKAAILNVTREYKARLNNQCTACGYCMPCPFGLKIPANFRIWNTGAVYEDFEGAKARYFELSEEERASHCQACGACEPQCPQGIEIIEDMKKVAALFEGTPQ